MRPAATNITAIIFTAFECAKHLHTSGWCLVPVAIIIFILGGCSSKPTAADARNIVEEQIRKEAGPVIRLVRFKKTLTQEAELMGVTFYTGAYEAGIEFLSDCYWGGPFGGFEVVTDQPTAFNTYLFVGKKRTREGQRETVTGEIQFEKTEKGGEGLRGGFIEIKWHFS